MQIEMWDQPFWHSTPCPSPKKWLSASRAHLPILSQHESLQPTEEHLCCFSLLRTDMIRSGPLGVISLFMNTKSTSSLIAGAISHRFHSPASPLQGVGYKKCVNQGEAAMFRSHPFTDCAFTLPLSTLVAKLL